MPRMSIYVPDELKVGMDEIGDRENWSAIAQSAFSRIVQIRQPMEDEQMESVIQRLRGTRIVEEDRLRAEGIKEGRDWAMNHATFGQLERVGEIDTDDIDEQDATYTLTCAAAGERLDGNEQQDMLEQMFGPHKVILGSRVIGFVEGAQEIWEQVGDKV